MVPPRYMARDPSGLPGPPAIETPGTLAEERVMECYRHGARSCPDSSDVLRCAILLRGSTGGTGNETSRFPIRRCVCGAHKPCHGRAALYVEARRDGAPRDQARRYEDRRRP